MGKKAAREKAAAQPPATPVSRKWLKPLVAALVVAGAAAVLFGYILFQTPAQPSGEQDLPRPQRTAEKDLLHPQPPIAAEPLRDFKIVNAHEHLMARQFLGKYFKAAELTGVARTLFVGSSEFTLKGSGFSQAKGNDENNAELLALAKDFPGRIIPFITIHPSDPDKLDKLKRWVADGAKGLKLYTGHSSFYERPLDAEDMMPVYAYCAETGLPICWHVNIKRYGPEFERVMAKFPKMTVIVPHFGVTFFTPGDASWRDFERMIDTYPNLYTDTSFGTRAILISGLEAVNQNPDTFRAFIKKYSDRVLFGTDMVITGNREKSVEWIADVIRACRSMLETKAYAYAIGAQGSPYASKEANNVHGTFRGLALDDETLKKIYETNFDRLFAPR